MTAVPSLWEPRSAHIQSIREEIPGTRTYEIGGDPLGFAPGQFNMVYLPGFGESAISISSDPQQADTYSHTIRSVGNVTRAIARYEVGDQILVRGPYGSAWPLEDCVGSDLVIATGGIGLAPLRPVIYHILNHRSDYGAVYLLYGARDPNGLLYRDEFDTWRQGGIDVVVTVDQADDAWDGQVGVVPMLFYRLRLDFPQTRVMTCGPEIMMRFVVFESLARRIPKQHVYLSLERNMNCAVGHCGHCQLGPHFVCKGGPVFSYQQLEPYLHLDDL